MTLMTGSFLVKPAEVEYHLGRAPFTYPANFEVDRYRGWGRVAVIPGLFGLMVELERFPSAAEGLAWLTQHCEAKYRDIPTVQRRGEKLYLDFARDMHTLGLLQECNFFGTVSYQKVKDMRYNVDFVARLLTEMAAWLDPEKSRVGVQAAMRRMWGKVDSWDTVKAERRAGRGDYTWTGPIYWLTNRARPPAKKIAGCWLFGPKHIGDLADEIAGDFGLSVTSAKAPEQVAVVQQELDLFN